MEHYDRRLVYAPEWMKDFACLAGDCPEVCCQQWNVDVDPAHAESLRHIDDPELQELMNSVLRSVRLRRPGSRHAETVHRLQLLNRPDRRCPLLNERNECRLHKKYGPYVLCDTCFFHPRTFFQIDEQTYLSACLSCPECARLALFQPEPTSFASFEAEIDPGAEWLETELISDPSARRLLLDRDRLIREIITRLQDRNFPLKERIIRALAFLRDAESEYAAAGAEVPENSGGPDDGGLSAEKAAEPRIAQLYTEVFDPVSDGMEQAARSAALFTRELAGGTEGYASLLAEQIRRGRALYEPFVLEHPEPEENFLVHCVFSDAFKQFYRYQNEAVSGAEILRHEARLLTAWYWYFRVLLCEASLRSGGMDEALFLRTVSRTDKTYWHYPDWFARCADRLDSVPADALPSLIRQI